MERGPPQCSQPKRSSNPSAESISAHLFDWEGNLIKEFISKKATTATLQGRSADNQELCGWRETEPPLLWADGDSAH